MWVSGDYVAFLLEMKQKSEDEANRDDTTAVQTDLQMDQEMKGWKDDLVGTSSMFFSGGRWIMKCFRTAIFCCRSRCWCWI